MITTSTATNKDKRLVLATMIKRYVKNKGYAYNEIYALYDMNGYLNSRMAST